MQRQVRRLGPNSAGEELAPGAVGDCFLGLLVDQPLAATLPSPGSLVVVGPSALLDQRVRQPDGRQVRAAIVWLDWLTAHGLTLATARQGDLELWLASPQTTHRREAGHFVRWARSHKLTSLYFPATKWGGPTRVLDAETRWRQARWLLHDDTLSPEDRAAGLLVLLYAQWPSVVSRLTLDHVQHGDDQVRLRLGREPVVLPKPLAGLVGELVATRRGHAALGDQGTSRWLFPGGRPGRPVSAYQLGERLRQLGLHPGQARSTALFQLATELPAALLARLLGIHIAVAVAWQRACSGDWAAYAAQVSRRTTPAGQ